MLDWEGEFSVVIGKPCHRVKAAKALDYVAGYTLVNDVSARDWVAPIFSVDRASWDRSTPGSTTCSARCSRPSARWGRASRRRDEIPDPGDVQIQTRLNGQVMQDANTDDLVFSVVEADRVLLAVLPLPARRRASPPARPRGVGFGRNPKVFMKAGDVVEVEVKQIGVLRNPIEA